MGQEAMNSWFCLGPLFLFFILFLFPILLLLLAHTPSHLGHIPPIGLVLVFVVVLSLVPGVVHYDGGALGPVHVLSGPLVLLFAHVLFLFLWCAPLLGTNIVWPQGGCGGQWKLGVFPPFGPPSGPEILSKSSEMCTFSSKQTTQTSI